MMKEPGIIIVAIIFLLTGCETHNTGSVEGTLVSHSSCKLKKASVLSSPVDNAHSCVAYTYLPAENRLLLTHINAGFNCCPGTISGHITRDGDTIKIAEKESAAWCDCDCLYDLFFEIEGVEPSSYYLHIIEPYNDDMNILNFAVDLETKVQDTVCVERANYPWGL